MNADSVKKIIIAGPNGAGKTTFATGLANLPRYCALVDVWDVYDNSGPVPVLLNEGAL